MEEPVSANQAKQRWFVIQATRIFGFAMVLAGILLTQGVITLVEGLDDIIGYGFILVGLIDGFYVPVILARQWRTPDR